MAKSSSCVDGRLMNGAGAVVALCSPHSPPLLNNTILPPKIKLYLYLYNTLPSSPALPPAVPAVYVTDKGQHALAGYRRQRMGRGHALAPCVPPRPEAEMG